MVRRVLAGPSFPVDVTGLDAILTGLEVGLAAGVASIGGVKDDGPQWVVTRVHTSSADMQTAAAITAAPIGGQKIVVDDLLVSVAVAMEFSIQMETSGNVLASVFLPANGTALVVLRDGLKGDAADKRIFGKASAGGNVRVTVCYHSEA